MRMNNCRSSNEKVSEDEKIEGKQEESNPDLQGINVSENEIKKYICQLTVVLLCILMCSFNNFNIFIKLSFHFTTTTCTTKLMLNQMKKLQALLSLRAMTANQASIRKQLLHRKKIAPIKKPCKN